MFSDLKSRQFKICYKINTNSNKSVSNCSANSLSAAGLKESVCEMQVKLILFSRAVKKNQQIC